MTASLSLDPAAFEKNLIRVVVMTKQASDRISRIPFKIPTAGFSAAMKAIRGMTAALSSFGKGGLSGIGASALVGGWTGFGGAVAGLGRQLVRGTADAYDYGREMMNFSRATGVAKEKSADFALALHDSMLTTNELVVAMRLMSEQMLRAAEGDKQAVHRFNQLGLSYRELLNMPMEEAFMRVGKALANTTNPALRSAAAIRMFGDTGAKTLKLFERGGALDMAKEALGGQSAIIGRNGEAFERVSIRLSHIGVKIRGIFLGIAETTLPMVEKLTDLFHKMDFTSWGRRLGAAINDAMAWLVTFWNDPAKTAAYFWEYAKGKAYELGNVLVDVGYKFGDAVAEALKNSMPEWLVSLGQRVSTGLSGMSAFFMDAVDRATGANKDADRFFNLTTGRNERPKAGADHFGAAAQMEKAAKIRPALEAARNMLGQNAVQPQAAPAPAPLSWQFQGMRGYGGIDAPRVGSTVVSTMTGALDAYKQLHASPGEMETQSLSGMHAGPYGASNLLKHRELVGFRNSRIAARMGRILASGKRDISDAEYRAGGGDYSDRRRPGETANGDRQRAKAFAREVARREAGQGTDNQLLGDIARNTADSKNILAEAFK